MNFEDFKRTDLAHFIEVLQVWGSIIKSDLGEQPWDADFEYMTTELWEHSKVGNWEMARRAVEFLAGMSWAVPESHRNSYRDSLVAVSSRIGY